MPTQTKSSLFGSVFTILIIDFRWWKSPPGHAAVDFPTIFQRYPTRRAVQTFETRRSNLYCNFFRSCANSKPTLAYLGVFLIYWKIIYDDWKAREASGHAILRRFSSVLRRPTPFKSLLPFFKFMCRLKINLTVFGSVFTDLRNKFRWLKSWPGYPVGHAWTPGTSLWKSNLHYLTN